MAWNPNIPTVTNRVQDDLDAIRENFQVLAGVRIVEMGSNSNGEYVRWENGLQLAWLVEQNVALSLSTTSLQGLTIYWQNRLWTFPASFIAPPAVLISLDVGPQVEMPSTEMAAPSNTSIAYSVTSLMSQTNARIICLLAIGRWK